MNNACTVVAHNALYDTSVLRHTMEHFNLPCPDFQCLCTYRLAARVWPELPNHQLVTLAAHIGHQFQHPHHQSDAEAAGRVLLAMMKQVSVETPNELLQKAGLEPKRFSQ